MAFSMTDEQRVDRWRRLARQLEQQADSEADSDCAEIYRDKAAMLTALADGNLLRAVALAYAQLEADNYHTPNEVLAELSRRVLGPPQ